MDKSKRYYTYILRCNDGTLYTGYTDDPKKRMAAHNAGTASKYTRGRLPVAFAYIASYATRSEAMSCEAKIKQLSRKQKLLLIEQWDGSCT